MEYTQRYIGAPNGVVVCVRKRSPYAVSGELYQPFKESATEFNSTEELLYIMEELFDRMGFPVPTMGMRSFTGKPAIYPAEKGMAKRMEDQEMLSKIGDLGTFVIRVQHRQNCSWQGRVTWLEEDKTVNFRSVWELVRLIDGALASGDSEPVRSWFEENTDK